MQVHGLLTVGHGIHTENDLLTLLRGAGVEGLVDIRIAPGSRRSPQLMRQALEEWVPAAGITYRWDQRLGGFRRATADSPDTALRNASFRAYASHMRTPPFRAAIDDLLAQAREMPTVVMCSESVWWRCHRRLVADHVELLFGREVKHLMPDARLLPHRPTSGVRLVGEDLVYDVG